MSDAMLGGKPSVLCELHEFDQIQISVYAPAPSRSTPGRLSDPLYEGYIVTRSAYLAEDIRSFEVFFEGVRIRSPAGERTD